MNYRIVSLVLSDQNVPGSSEIFVVKTALTEEELVDEVFLSRDKMIKEGIYYWSYKDIIKSLLDKKVISLATSENIHIEI